MGYATEILEGARRAAAPPDEHLKEARRRRDEVLRAAKAFSSVRASFPSGSIAHATANKVNDADCGVILDRRSHPSLGPDGDNVGPKEVVEEVRAFLRDETDLKEIWSGIVFRVENRAIKVFFHDEIADDVDPTVDLIVALDRKDEPGLWIPKGMLGASPAWDASHPEKHTALFLPDDSNLRRTRVHVTRLAKAANHHSGWRFSSFNLAALAYWGIDSSQNLGDALYAFYDYAAKDMKDHLTSDPAGVSSAIKLPVTKDKAVSRLEKQRDLMASALDADSEDEAREALAKLIPDWIDAPAGGAAAVASALRAGNLPKIGSSGVVAGNAAIGRALKKNVRSYGAS